MASQASIIRKTVGGAAWTVLTSVGSRIIGGVGTIVVTYFISPEIAGEVKVAYILVVLSHEFTTFGIAQFIASKPKEGPDVVWHATVLHLGIGIPAILASIPIAYVWSSFFAMPGLMAYVPGLALAVVFERLHIIPERVLTRELRFRPVGLARGFSEILYTVLVIGMAAVWTRVGFHPHTIGMSIVYANVAQYAFMFAYNTAASNRKVWLTPAKWSWDTVRAIFRFGIPISVAGLSSYASRNVDTLVFAKMFGPAPTGAYDKAYNLADIPAVQVGEQIGDVLLPSFAQMEESERKKALVRSTALLSIIIFPLATGLGATAHTLIRTILPEEWWSVGPMLAILSGLAVVRPVGWTIMSYLQACDRPRTVMIIGILKVIVLLAAVALFGQMGPLWACVGVSVGFLFHAISGMWVIKRVDGIPLFAFVRSCSPPLVACIPMVAAVLGARWLWEQHGWNVRGLGFGVEVLVGALVYIPSALVLARGTSMDLIELVRDQIRSRRNRGKGEEEDDEA
jgi:PST family polysaccharide transporter